MTGMLRDPGPRVVLQPRGFPDCSLQWGQPWQIGTAAYWVALTRCAAPASRPGRPARQHRLGADLAEEVAACLLGGHGLPHQAGLAAFAAVRDEGLLAQPATAARIEQVLRRPLRVGDRTVRYRFPAQRARYLAQALARLRAQAAPESALELREWLLASPGIGPKTAGWIVRNHLGSDEIAIIDIHLLRAGIQAGVFEPGSTPTRNYAQLEALFLAWAGHGEVSSADLDAVIWNDRARTGGV
jgi:N-glycosylase/DNA lyase